MKIRIVAAAAALVGAVAFVPAHAGAQEPVHQDTTHKPGGLNKVAHATGKAVSKAGKQTAKQAKRTGHSITRAAKPSVRKHEREKASADSAVLARHKHQ